MKTSISGVGVITALLSVSMSVQAGLLLNSAPGATVTYTAITEDISGFGTGTYGGTYGTPTISGDQLDFNPTLFAAGAEGTYMETDAYLTFDVTTDAGFHITELDFSEAGDSRLREIDAANPVGTASTYTEVNFTYFVDILEVDGVANPGNGNGDAFFASFSLPGDIGTKVWSGSVSIDIEQILIDNKINYEFGATAVRVTIDNLLYAYSEQGTSATIKKKDLDGFAVTAVSIPEPASAVLLIGTTSGLVFIRRRLLC